MLESSPNDPWWFRVPAGVWIVVGGLAIAGIAALILMMVLQRYRSKVDEWNERD